MTPTAVTIHAEKVLPYPPAAVFAHWISPETRQRWEAGPETGMTYDAFDTREGGVEIVRIHHEGNEVGHMTQRIERMIPDEMLAVSIAGTFGGVTSLMMQLVMRFEAHPKGTRVSAISQVIDLSGRDIEAEQKHGWDWMMTRFADDIATYGLITGDAK